MSAPDTTINSELADLINEYMFDIRHMPLIQDQEDHQAELVAKITNLIAQEANKARQQLLTEFLGEARSHYTDDGMEKSASPKYIPVSVIEAHLKQLAVLNPEWAAKEAKKLGLLKVKKLIKEFEKSTEKIYKFDSEIENPNLATKLIMEALNTQDLSLLDIEDALEEVSKARVKWIKKYSPGLPMGHPHYPEERESGSI